MRINPIIPGLLCAVLFLSVQCSQPSEPGRPPLFLPDDLEATVWAESPRFYNPTNMDVDARGRIWITEAVNYRNYNNDSSKFLHHAKGDRVVILEDTNHDGIADTSKVFVEDRDLVSPLGIAVFGNRIFVSCSPNLIVYTDLNGDDVPDKKEIFLTGFGGKDHDHSLHAVVGGPDGNLYFNTGNAGPHVVKDRSGWTLRSGSIYTGGSPYNTENHGSRKSDDGKIWVGGLALRINPDGTGLKVMGHNFRNSYEVITDSFGNLWQNDNDDQVVACRTSWLMEGGNAGYFSSDGTRYWQADQRPWQDVFTAHWHQEDPGIMPAGDKTGAGAPTGVVVNEGDDLGESYRGLLLSADAGRNTIFGFHPVLKSSGYDLGTRSNFITSLQDDNVGYVWNDSAQNTRHDKWFRPSDVTIGTDGAIYVADWYDPVVGGHQMLDPAGYGRIYRIAPKNKKLVAPTFDFNSVQGLIEVLKNPAINVRYQAFEKLRSRGTEAVGPVKTLLNSPNPYHQARAIWLLSQLGAEGRSEVQKLLLDKNELIRITAFRALRLVESDILPIARQLSSDSSSFLRREVAIALRDLPFEKTKSVLSTLASHYDGKDIWYLNAIAAAAAGHEEEMFSEIRKQFGGPASKAEQWDPRLASFAFALHPASAVADLKTRANSMTLGEPDRDQAMTGLSFINSKEAAKAMIDLAVSARRDVSGKAMYWVAFRQSNDWYSLIDWSKTGINAEHEREVADMKVRQIKILDPVLPVDEKKWNLQAMSKSAVGVQMVLAMLSEKKLPEKLLPVTQDLLLKNSDPTVRLRASAYFKVPGADRPLSAAAISNLKGNAIAGKAIFEKACTTCHQVNKTGNSIGPDLSFIGKKFDRNGLLDAILNPSAAIVFGYDTWVIVMNDGETVFGFVVADGWKTIVVRDLSGQRHVLEVGKIKSRKRQDQSIMPMPSSLGLSEQNLSDLTEYLLTLK